MSTPEKDDGAEYVQPGKTPRSLTFRVYEGVDLSSVPELVRALLEDRNIGAALKTNWLELKGDGKDLLAIMPAILNLRDEKGKVVFLHVPLM